MEDHMHITREQFRSLSPRAKGYVYYMRSECKLCDVRDVPKYPEGSIAAQEYEAGELQGVLEAQDSEE